MRNCTVTVEINVKADRHTYPNETWVSEEDKFVKKVDTMTNKLEKLNDRQGVTDPSM